MYFTDNQKELIKLITIGKIKDIQTMFAYFFDNNMANSFSTTSLVCEYFNLRVPNKNTAAEQKLVDFIIIKQFLEKENLITLVNRQPRNGVHETFSNSYKNDSSTEESELKDSMKNISTQLLIPSSELQSFIDRQFTTIKEYNYQQEKTARKKAQTITISIAVLVPLLTTLINLIFNFYINKTYQVKLINAKETQDAIFFENIEEQCKTPIDTIKTDKIDSNIKK